MFDDSLSLDSPQKEFASSSKNNKALFSSFIRVEGHNEDITESYHWLLNFAYYTGKGYTPLKLEDYHYFSENSQFGMNLRQMKGGSIRAFQENLNQMINLVKNLLMPVLKEIKQADFYYSWFSKVYKFDKLLQDELKKPENQRNNENLNKWRNERNEAISHLKDEWVNKVEGGRLWQTSRSATEQGLDFSLTPQLFFGTNLDNPLYELHKSGRSLKEQLDDDIYSVDITVGAKENVARFMYRFYHWLPTALKDTEVSFKIKISTLKQYYANLQMQIGFMKPLLIEIMKKNEGFDKKNKYHNFHWENPEFSNLFDHSYSFVRILGIRNLDIRGPHKIEDLEFTKFGLWVEGGKDILFGPALSKKGFIRKEVDKKYEFFETSNKNISIEEFNKIEPLLIDKEDLKAFPIMEYEISQSRRVEMQQTQQGPAQIPHMQNKIIFNGYSWNLFEIASYREQLKEDNLLLLASFVDEVNVMKEDLLHYVNYFEGDTRKVNFKETNSIESDKISKNLESSDSSMDLIFGPFKGIGVLLSPLVPKFGVGFKKKQKSTSDNSARTNHHKIVKYSAAEDVWKVYTIYKKSHGLIQY